MRFSRTWTSVTVGGIVGLTTCSVLSGCGVETSSNTSPPAIPARVDRLAEWLTGSFDSADQAARDSAILDIHLNACAIWPDRVDGRWIYVEQSRGDAVDRPYRQRIYRLRVDDQGRLVSEVFAFSPGTVPDAGSWRDPAALDRVDPTLLTPREGCTVFLESTPDGFDGGTLGRGCESTLSGATYATSEVKIDATSISSWDRGYDNTGQQVWGATEGPYTFKRRR